MKKYLQLGTGAIASVFLFALLILINPNIASSANTYSVDFESGSSQYLSIADGSQTGLDLSSAFTFEAWIKPESQPDTNSNITIISKHNNGSDEGYELVYRNENGTYKLFLRVSEAADGTDSDSFKVTQTLNNDTWYHVAVTWDGATKIAKFYVNGTQVGGDQTGANVISNRNSGATFAIGTTFTSGSASLFWDGLIDDVRVWNFVRTATEIADDRSRELFGNESGLVGYWKLNNSLVDYSPNGNNLTNNGSAVFSTSTPFEDITENLKVRKLIDETVTNSTVLQNDDSLKLTLLDNKTYIIDGVIFASSTSPTPDIKIAFFGPTGSTITIGYTNDVDEAVLGSGLSSARIEVPTSASRSIHIKGTIKTTSTSGDLQLKWSQFATSANGVTVMEGSYLRAESI